jgi:hypothetical protein
VTLDLARNILGAFPAPVFGCLRGQNSKDLTVRQLAVLLAVEALGPVSTEKLVSSLPGTHAQLARPLDQLLDRLLLSHEDGMWRLTLKGKAVLDTAPDRQPAKVDKQPSATAELSYVAFDGVKVIDFGKLLAVEPQAVKQAPVQQVPVQPPKPQLVVDAEQAVARLELQYKDDRSPRLFALLNQAYADLDEARACAKAEAKPGPKAKPRKPKHKEA